ncbi:MAG: glycosyltransferase involved in cell wall biosynthesis [Oleiphilaceae bacterium]|jgi:glycosyltransferase involved in cell wall biosynthesis
MDINHIIDSIDSNAGGTSSCLASLSEALSPFAKNTIRSIKSICPLDIDKSVIVDLYNRSFKYLPLGCSNDLNRALKDSSSDIFHAHGLWQMSTHYAVINGCKNNIPVLISPHGMLEPGALQFSRWKKQVAGWLWQNQDLRRASCIHVTSQMEADNCRIYGLKNPIAIVPNGINLVDYPLKRAVDSVSDSAGQYNISEFIQEKRTLLFLSRIHGKKGLTHLLEAWAQLPQFHSTWQVVIAGNDDGGHEADLKKMASRLGIKWSTERMNKTATLYFPGPLFGDAKIAAYHEADLFVLPTLSENFGMVVAEALACGTPVLTTKGAPWKELDNTNSGWWIDIGTESLKTSLQDAFLKTPEELIEMGLRGRALINDYYSIESVAKKMMSVYKWCLSGENTPVFVQFD